jgi:hypothetical protein
MTLAALAYAWGRMHAPAPAQAQAPKEVPVAAETGSDYSRRVVAYIYGTEPITREDLGEFLIARLGAEKLELLINKRIIERACREKGIEVTAAEVEAAVADDCRAIKVNLKDFIDNVLKKYQKTLYEWKEDVIRPRLLLGKIARERVQVTEADIQFAYQAHYGEKRECRILLYPRDMQKIVMTDIYGKVRDSEEEFVRAARSQPSPTLAAVGGKIPPIGRGTTGNDNLEKVAFSLRPGETSEVVETPDGLLIIKCDKVIPPSSQVKPAEVRAQLEKECFDRKLQLMIPVVFEEMKKKAEPQVFLRKVTTEEELLRSVRQELQGKPPARSTAPNAN